MVLLFTLKYIPGALHPTEPVASNWFVLGERIGVSELSKHLVPQRQLCAHARSQNATISDPHVPVSDVTPEMGKSVSYRSTANVYLTKQSEKPGVKKFCLLSK